MNIQNKRWRKRNDASKCNICTSCALQHRMRVGCSFEALPRRIRYTVQFSPGTFRGASQPVSVNNVWERAASRRRIKLRTHNRLTCQEKKKGSFWGLTFWPASGDVWPFNLHFTKRAKKSKLVSDVRSFPIVVEREPSLFPLWSSSGVVIVRNSLTELVTLGKHAAKVNVRSRH